METFTINFSMDEMRVIDEALGNMPYKKVAPIISNINAQIQKNRAERQTIDNTAVDDIK